jgi:hypothetical protein
MKEYSVWLEHFVKINLTNNSRSRIDWKTEGFLSIRMISKHRDLENYMSIFSLNKKFHSLKTDCIWQYNCEFCTNDPKFNGDFNSQIDNLEMSTNDYWIFKKMEESSGNLTYFIGQ